MLVLVSLLALALLGAVRVGARAMADGPANDAGPARAIERSVSASSSPIADPSAARDPSGQVVVDIDRGATVTPTPGWATVLDLADSGRQRALAGGDAAALRSWVDPEGSAWAADSALAVRVRTLGARIDGGALVVLEVRPVQVTDTAALLLVLDRRESYTVTTSAGTSAMPARAARWWQVSLRRTTGSDGAAVWRIRDVVPTSAPAAGG